MKPTVFPLSARLAASLFLFAGACATAAAPDEAKIVDARSAAGAVPIHEAMARDHIPALSVAVMRDGALVWSEAFGKANLETGADATRETKFRLGSVSKVFTADLAALLAEKGVVDLDTDIREYLPVFPDKGATITLRQLLTHTGGIRHYVDEDFDGEQPGGSIDTRHYPDAASKLAIFADHPLVAAPGTKSEYSTFGYTLAGLVLEAASGKSLQALFDEHLMGPAGISDIVVDDRFAIISNRTEFYDSTSEYADILDISKYGPVINAAPLNSAYKIAGGGLIGDAEALAAFGALHLRPGFFSEATWRAIFSKQKLIDGTELPLGFGWRIGEDANGRRVFHHSGSQQGARAFLAVYPDDELVIAYMTNLGGLPEESFALAQAIAEPFFAK